MFQFKNKILCLFNIKQIFHENYTWKNMSWQFHDIHAHDINLYLKLSFIVQYCA